MEGRQIGVIFHATKNHSSFIEALIFRLLKETFEWDELVTYANCSKVGS